MIEETTVWRTDDGAVHDTFASASRHTENVKFDDAYPDGLYGSGAYKSVCASDLRGWLAENKAMVLAWFKSQEE